MRIRRWNPRLHPRGRNGKFVNKIGTSYGSNPIPKQNRNIGPSSSRRDKLRAASRPYGSIAGQYVGGKARKAILRDILKTAAGPVAGPQRALDAAGTASALYGASSEARRLYLDPAARRRLSAKRYAKFRAGQDKVDKANQRLGKGLAVIGIAQVIGDVAGPRVASKISSRAAANRASAASASRGLRAGLRPTKARRGVHNISSIKGKRVR